MSKKVAPISLIEVMSQTSFLCDVDEDGNPILVEVHSNGQRTKVVTLFPDGRIVFEAPYDKESKEVQAGWIIGVRTCPRNN